MACIYKITNTVNGKIYIGQTLQKDVRKRWNRHKSDLNHNKRISTHLQSAWNKYGEAAFSFEVIEQFDSEMNFDLNNLERYWIKHFDSMNPEKGYNLTEGGFNAPKTEETKKKLAQYRGENSSMFGRKHSEEARKKISDAHKGKPKTKESIEKRLKSIIGKLAGEKNPMFGKPSPRRKKVVCLNNGKVYDSQTEAAKELKLHAANINSVCIGKRDHTKGYKFNFYNENSEVV